MEATYRKKYPFIDNEIIQSVTNLRRVVNQAVVHPDPVLKMDAPWDSPRDMFNCMNVIYDERQKLFKMWYCVVDCHGQKWDGQRKWAYAVSEDGVQWEKPILGLHEVNGTTKNNYIFPLSQAFFFSLIDDPSDIDDRRYKMICMAQQLYEGGQILDRVGYHVPLSLGYSHDGIDWQFPRHVNPVMRGVSDGGSVLFYDRDRRKYILWTRRVPNVPRDISQYESWDLVNWEDCGRVMVAGDEYDPPEMFNLQSMTPLQYGDFYLGLIGAQCSLPFAESYESHNKPPAGFDHDRLGRIDIQLSWSRDGRTWHRPKDRTPVWPSGLRCNNREVPLIFPQFNAPPVVNGDTYIFSTGVEYRHSHWHAQEIYHRDKGDVRNQAFAMLAKMPEDRWMSLDAGDEEGILLTREVGLPQRLLVNTEIQAGGYIAAEYVTPYGEVCEGFSREECIPVSESGKAQEIRWRAGKDGWPLNAKYLGGIFMRIFVKKAKLFSLIWEQPDPDGGAARYWANNRWSQIIKHTSDQWGSKTNAPTPGLPPYQMRGPAY